MNLLFKFYHKYKKLNLLLIIIRFLYHKLFFNKKLILNSNVKINNIRFINSKDFLEIGVNNTGFIHKSELTYLNLNGELKFASKYSIGRGCKIDISKGGKISIGSGGYINSYTKLIISHLLKIGDNCIISWNCQFLDEDFHEIQYDGKLEKETNGIVIGNNVWIGCNVKVYKGTVIADNCVISSDSVVKGVFDKKNCLIGGYPAKVLKENIKWY